MINSINTEEISCFHDNVEFIGLYSLIGNYFCKNCKEKLEPQIYHRMKGQPTIDDLAYLFYD